MHTFYCNYFLLVTRGPLHSGAPGLCLPCLPHCYATGSRLQYLYELLLFAEHHPASTPNIHSLIHSFIHSIGHLFFLPFLISCFQRICSCIRYLFSFSFFCRSSVNWQVYDNRLCQLFLSSASLFIQN